MPIKRAVMQLGVESNQGFCLPHSTEMRRLHALNEELRKRNGELMVELRVLRCENSVSGCCSPSLQFFFNFTCLYAASLLGMSASRLLHFPAREHFAEDVLVCAPLVCPTRHPVKPMYPHCPMFADA